MELQGLLVALAVAIGVWLLLILVLILAGRGVLARELALLLPNLAVLFRGLLADPRVPRRSKLLLLIGLVWIASPIDLIPEFIPVAGPLDDAIVAAIILRYLVRSAGGSVVREHWRGDQRVLERLLWLAGLPAGASTA